jgi:Histidine kinase-, DNA gyrase B-, and HSP90-like ATPase/His Kinase A (phospho-acceptor) domain
MALKDEFLSVMAHELRHPLNMININVELLARMPEIRKSAPFMRAATIIRNAVLSQAKIIDDLMDVSRVRTGKLSLAMAPVALGAVLQNIAEVQRADPATHDIRIDVIDEAEGVYVLADLVRIEQVVLNLLSNAVKFTPGGGHIDVRLVREEGGVRVDVTDSGQGIAPDFLPHVFDMYDQGVSVTTRSKGGHRSARRARRSLLGRNRQGRALQLLAAAARPPWCARPGCCGGGRRVAGRPAHSGGRRHGRDADGLQVAARGERGDRVRGHQRARRARDSRTRGDRSPDFGYFDARNGWLRVPDQGPGHAEAGCVAGDRDQRHAARQRHRQGARRRLLGPSRQAGLVRPPERDRARSAATQRG